MSAITRTAVGGFRRQCVASSSRPRVAAVLARGYATETALPSNKAPEAGFGGASASAATQGTTLKKYVGKGFPRIPGLRHLVLPHHPHLYEGDPLRALTIAQRKKGGRNDTGRVVNRAVGGGHRRRLRIVDFLRVEPGEHDVIRIEYDPGRSAHIALVRQRLVEGVAKDVSIDEGAILAEQEEGAVSPGTPAEERRRLRNEVRGGWSYILAPEGLRAGDVVTSYRSGIPKNLVEGWNEDQTQSQSSEEDEGFSASAIPDLSPEAPQTVENPANTASGRALGLLRTLTLKPGNVLPLYLLPSGTIIHNISLSAEGRMQLCRSAGSNAQVIAHHGPNGEALGGADILNMGGDVKEDGTRGKKQGTVLVKLQSGEVRRFEPGCAATVGTVSNKEHHSTSLGKAGRSRWLGQRPRVRGVAMNACDHPHGGGRGKSKGNKHPRSVWGWLTKGKRTRRPKDRDGNKMVVSERPRGKEKN